MSPGLEVIESLLARLDADDPQRLAALLLQNAPRAVELLRERHSPEWGVGEPVL